MTNDYAAWLKYVPIVGLIVLAYSVMGAALHGAFEMNIVQLIALPIVVVISLIIYWALFRNMAKKELTGKKSFFASFIAVTLVMLLFFGVALASMFFVEPLYVASPKMNIVIAIICAIIFVVGAIGLGSWMIIGYAILLFAPQILFNFTTINREWQLFGGAVVSMILITLVTLVHLVVLSKRESKVEPN